jgi:hypothetical protein
MITALVAAVLVAPALVLVATVLDGPDLFTGLQLAARQIVPCAGFVESSREERQVAFSVWRASLRAANGCGKIRGREPFHQVRVAQR